MILLPCITIWLKTLIIYNSTLELSNYFIVDTLKKRKEVLFNETRGNKSVCDQLDSELSVNQLKKLNYVLNATLSYYDLIQKKDYQKVVGNEDNLNNKYLEMYTSSKKVEGCSAQTIIYYEATLKQFFKYNHKLILDINTEDIRAYLAKYQNDNKVSKVTLDNVRRIFSSFFT